MLIGGAAMAVHGVDDTAPADIDIVLSGSAAAHIAARHGWQNYADGGSGPLRSDYILRPDLGRVPVELLGNFRIRDGDGWIHLALARAVTVSWCEQQVPVLPLNQLAQLFRPIRREKDFRRAALVSGS